NAKKSDAVISRENQDTILPSIENAHNGAVALREFTNIEPNEQVIDYKPKILKPPTPTPLAQSMLSIPQGFSPPFVVDTTRSPTPAPPHLTHNIQSSPFSGITSSQGTAPTTTTYAPPLSPTFSSTYAPTPAIPPRPISHVNPIYTQAPLNQAQPVLHSNNPQYDPAVARTFSPPAMRAPQATTNSGSGATDQDLLEQINSLQAEWIRRQANQQS
ncbi:hypothetical protein BGZ95_004672, partial [Linnemannia exigua]